MGYQVLDAAGIDTASGLATHATSFAQRLESALNKQKDDRGMELLDVVTTEDGPLFIFVHESDRSA